MHQTRVVKDHANGKCFVYAQDGRLVAEFPSEGDADAYALLPDRIARMEYCLQRLAPCLADPQHCELTGQEWGIALAKMHAWVIIALVEVPKHQDTGEKKD